MDELRSRVARERKLRGLSVRGAAALGEISNTTWGNWEKGGPLTDGVRLAVALAFGWPTTWPEAPPAPTPLDPGQPTNADILEAVTALTMLVQNMGDAVELLAAQALGPATQADPLARGPVESSRRSSRRPAR
jgi:hypothetical protein